MNHSLLTIDHARKKGLHVACVIINNYPENPGLSEENNPNMIKEMSGLPVLVLRQLDDSDTPALINKIADEIDIENLMELVG